MEWVEGRAAPPEIAVPEGQLRIFGYGSLMWHPGFPFSSIEPAVVHGWHRSFCISSTGHRGTPEWPGLVVGLASGGNCRGMLITVAPEHKDATLHYLWQREMLLADGYRPQPVAARLQTGTELAALTFVADTEHESFVGELPLGVASERVAHAYGRRGSNREYLERTLAHLDGLGIDDPGMSALAAAVASCLPRPLLGQPHLE